jgi:FtsZ-binding cell division protein ZapB
MECDFLGKIYLLEEKIGGLTKENKELTDKNKELTDKNEQLRGQMKTIRKIEGKMEQHE